jgi:hypothetical protein
MNNVVGRSLFALTIASLWLLLCACSVNVDDKDKKNGKVDIQTPFANLKVDSSEKAANTGIPVYPGAHLRPKDNDDSHAVNLNLGAIGFGLKVIAAEYETDDSPEKVKAFYQDKMKAFGPSLTCNGHSSNSDIHLSGHKHDDDDDKKLNCSDSHGDGWEIKAGSSDNERTVSIEPHGSGTRFGLVLVQTHDKDNTL